MKEFKGKSAKIHIASGDEDLFYTAYITQVTKKHIVFRDRFGDLYCYRISDVVEISGTT